MLERLTKLSRQHQIFFSLAVVIIVSGICYWAADWMDYKVVSLLLLLTVSFIASVFDIVPVLAAATLSALIWNFFFIEPKYTFHIGSAEDGVLFLMYFLIVFINGVLTNRMRRIEKQVREKEEKEKSVKLYNTLLSSLSHELKTPIAAIVGATDNLMAEPDRLTEENKKELISGISVASLRLNQQVENLLSMSRLESGFLQLKKDWTDIKELLYDVIKRLEQQLKHHRLVIRSDDNLPFYKLDYGLMEQVLYNLLYNAALYTPEYSDILIQLSNHADKIYTLEKSDYSQSRIQKETNLLVIVVEDRGPGFPPDEIQKVFDKFYRLSNAKTGGSGLGLSIVKGFTEAHNGTVTLENVPHGARFTIEIPAEISYVNTLKNE